jgi:uncharacterized metal-binding protein
MPELPPKKVGIVACSGEELAEGTVTRLAALRVLEQLRPQDTVTICLPLFLAGGEGDRAFARFYPTIAVDGCDLRCAARATEMYSGKPAAGIVVTEVVRRAGLDQPGGRRRLNEAGRLAVDVVADEMAGMVDDLLGKRWSRRRGEFIEAESPVIELDIPVAGAVAAGANAAGANAACACGSGIPVQTVMVNGAAVSLIALPAIFEQFAQAGQPPADEALLEQVRIYNPIPAGQDDAYRQMLRGEYEAYCAQQEPAR